MTSAAYIEIARVLAGARRRQVRAIALAAGGFGGAAVLTVLLGGASAVALGARIGLRPWVLGLALAAAAAAVAWAARAALGTAWSEEAAARTVARSQPALRSDLLSSIELARARDDIAASGHFSVALVDGHIERTAERAGRVDLVTAVPDRLGRLGGLALVGVAAVHAAAFMVGGGGLARAYGRVLAGDPPGVIAADAEPITGDVELTFRYPAYTRREPRTVSGTGGEIRAPKGTEVELRTRADRPVKAAELAVTVPGADGQPAEPRRVGLAVTGERDLAGRLLVEAAGTYRFRFLDGRGKLVAAGPSIPITVEVDDAPDVRITAPEREIEVDPGAVVRIGWQAEDDVGLSEVALVVKAPGAPERREVLRKPEGARRDRGERVLDLAPEKLAEGESLVYWVEALDGDTVSGPKKASSETQTVRIYSEAEHRRQIMEKAKQVLDGLIVLLADRLETFAAGTVATAERLPVAQALDLRTRRTHERMREVAREIRRDRAGPPEVAAALSNVAAGLRNAEARLAGVRASVANVVRMRLRPDAGLMRTMAAFDGQLDAELEKGILYLEQLMDKQRAEDLVRLAKDLASSRRDLANLLERYRKAPTEQARAEVMARVQRMKERVKELLSRMAELAKGFQDEHMNTEALAEMERSQDLLSGLDEIEKKLAEGDVEGAMKALDEMASTMDRMLAGLERTAGRPDEQNQELMKEMLAFKDALEKVKGEQERTAAETERIRSEYRKKLADRLKGAEKELARLTKLAGEARKDVEDAQPGVSPRTEDWFERSKESLSNLERALGMKDIGTAWETVQQALPSTEKLAQYLEEDARLAEGSGFPPGADGQRIEDAHERAAQAVPLTREVRDGLSKLFPDPRQVLGQDAQRKLDELARRQAALEKQAGGLQQSLAELMQRAPVFPPDAPQQLGESRGHMGQAAAELAAKNPQRGHGQQELALDALDRFQKGLEEAAKRGRGQGGGQGFPFPFAQAGPGEQEGDGRDPSRERVEIPGAEAHKVPEEFRKDLLEAMKQGAPERYRADVQRYYEELVK